MEPIEEVIHAVSSITQVPRDQFATVRHALETTFEGEVQGYMAAKLDQTDGLLIGAADELYFVRYDGRLEVTFLSHLRGGRLVETTYGARGAMDQVGELATTVLYEHPQGRLDLDVGSWQQDKFAPIRARLREWAKTPTR